MQVARHSDWPVLLEQSRQAVPEAFGGDDRPLNLIAGKWSQPGRARLTVSPVDGRELARLPMVDLEQAQAAVSAAAAEAKDWGKTSLEIRRARVAECVGLLKVHRDLIARLLIWEIGKPLAQSETDVDRCVSGVEWYLTEIDRMTAGREPIGVVSNIASWNYPYSVLMHSVLVQVLAGNAAIAKTPTDGGLVALTVGFALARRAGLPVTLLSGAGGDLAPALVRNADVDCLAFVGGRSSGRAVAASLVDTEKRYMIEMEGVNAYGVWNYSDWPTLADQIKKGYDYGKQRCTAYARFVVERRLFPEFLEAYLGAANKIRVGNPVGVDSPDDALPVLDFGPVINRTTAEGLKKTVETAVSTGAVPLVEGRLDRAAFIAGQDARAYVAPVALLNVPRNSRLYHKEPFGPVDTFVVVDSVEDLISEMNISNGSLVASLACDDEDLSSDIGAQVRGFKFGRNALRSRGDRDEVFGGTGQSWRGCFVGGRYLVEAVTTGGQNDRLYGNFADYERIPEKR